MEDGLEGGPAGGMEDGGVLAYRLCPRCFRAVPMRSTERYCVNDGARMLDRCPACGAAIGTPLARHCANCGEELAGP